MRVIVFGSTGMVGRAVVARLSSQPDLDLVAISRETHAFDVCDSDGQTARLLRDAVFAVNCIGILRGDPSYGTPEYQRTATLVNALWPQRLADVTSGTDCHVVHLSTDAVFTPAPDPAEETTPVSPSEMYGISKALGEVDAAHVINVRFSVIGPAPDRPPSLWEWLVRQPRDAVVHGYATFGWSGCTSRQLGWLVSDLVAQRTFETVRSAGPAFHFSPNGTATKFSVLEMLAARLRPDIKVLATPQSERTSRALSSSVMRQAAYSGTCGWQEAVAEATGPTM